MLVPPDVLLPIITDLDVSCPAAIHEPSAATQRTLLAGNGAYILGSMNKAARIAKGFDELPLVQGQPKFADSVPIPINPIAIQ